MARVAHCSNARRLYQHATQDRDAALAGVGSATRSSVQCPLRQPGCPVPHPDWSLARRLRTTVWPTGMPCEALVATQAAHYPCMLDIRVSSASTCVTHCDRRARVTSRGA